MLGRDAAWLFTLSIQRPEVPTPDLRARYAAVQSFRLSLDAIDRARIDAQPVLLRSPPVLRQNLIRLVEDRRISRQAKERQESLDRARKQGSREVGCGAPTVQRSGEGTGMATGLTGAWPGPGEREGWTGRVKRDQAACRT